METTKGKLVNKDLKKELAFLLNPTSLQLDRSYEFNVEPCLAQPAPMVSFQTGGLTTLSYELVFDKDINSKFNIHEILSFLKSLDKVQKSTQSVPSTVFIYGSFRFSGYVKNYQLSAHRFDRNGNITGAKVSVQMISNGEFENGA